LKKATAFLVLLAVVLGGALSGCGGSSGGAGLPSRESAPNYGTLIDQPVPAALDKLPMTNQHGEKTSLGAFRGKTVVLVPFLTLCADICPFTTGILLQVEKALKAAHATSKAEIVELTVDPHRGDERGALTVGLGDVALPDLGDLAGGGVPVDDQREFRAMNADRGIGRDFARGRSEKKVAARRIAHRPSGHN